MTSVEVHVIVNDADWITPWMLRHYCRFAHVIVHDGGPEFSDSKLTRELCLAHGASWEPFDTAGELNDDMARVLKNTCWQKTEADWVICCDADELLHFPQGAEETLSVYEKLGAAAIKPHGFEMFSDSMPELGAQITDCIKTGASEEDWYAKPILFSAKRVADSGFGIGAHESRVVLKDGRAVLVRTRNGYHRADPPTYLLHYKAIGSLDQVAERYEATRRRLSLQNVRQGWGNIHDTGVQHATKKREIIFKSGLRNVVA